jgi:PAS domain S-box-containing protein
MATKREQTDDALQGGDDDFRTIFYENPLPMIVSEIPSGTIAFVNKRFAALLKKSPGEIIGKTANDLGLLRNPDDLDRLTELISGRREVADVEINKLLPGGRQGADLVSMRLVVISGKQYCLSVIQDISALKQTEEAKRESEKRYCRLVETTDTGYVIVDKNGKVLDANHEYVRMSGHGKLDEILGRCVIEWTAKEESQVNADAIATCIKKGLIRNFEITYIDKNNKRTPVEINATAIDMDGEQKILTLCRDITDRKRMEDELQKAQKIESLGLLAGGIAHDFNNLLTGIFGYIDIARITSTDALTTGYLAATLANLNRAKALAAQLLTFSKGGAPIQKVTQLTAFIRETAQFALSGSNSSCTFFLEENLWSCNIDKNQIAQVIDNIVINAKQAMPSGGNIEIAAQNVSLKEKQHPPLVEGIYVKVSVKDFGIGIARDILPRIFDPFFTTKPMGHGLGLATCFSILSRHGGCIDVASEPGKGSTFHVYLPATQKAAETDYVANGKHKGSGTILVVDDEDVVRQTFQLILKLLGYTVVCKNDGKSAIDFYIDETKANNPFVAMIFDLTIPGAMGGMDAAKEIRKLDDKIPIFVTSGYSDNSIMQNPREYGLTASIPKPFTIAEISEILNKHLVR